MANDGTFALGRVLKAGAVAGLVFAVFQVVASLVLAGPSAAFTPIRLIGAIVLGREALDPGYSLLAAGAAGLVFHLALSMIFAVIFASMIPVSFAMATEVELGMAYGFLLWVFNYHLVGPALGWTWFAQTNPIAQMTVHTLAYGAVLGWFRHHAWMADESHLDPEVHAFHALN